MDHGEPKNLSNEEIRRRISSPNFSSNFSQNETFDRRSIMRLRAIWNKWMVKLGENI